MVVLGTASWSEAREWCGSAQLAPHFPSVHWIPLPGVAHSPAALHPPGSCCLPNTRCLSGHLNLAARGSLPHPLPLQVLFIAYHPPFSWPQFSSGVLSFSQSQGAPGTLISSSPGVGLISLSPTTQGIAMVTYWSRAGSSPKWRQSNYNPCPGERFLPLPLDKNKDMHSLQCC